MTQPVYCTKIASRLVRTFTDRHGLKDLCKDLLGIELSKQQQSSDWGAAELTQEQLRYAASDVLHLHALKAHLDEMLAREGRTRLGAGLLRLPAQRGPSSIWPAGRSWTFSPIKDPSRRSGFRCPAGAPDHCSVSDLLTARPCPTYLPDGWAQGYNGLRRFGAALAVYCDAAIPYKRSRIRLITGRHGE